MICGCTKCPYAPTGRYGKDGQASPCIEINKCVLREIKERVGADVLENNRRYTQTILKEAFG